MTTNVQISKRYDDGTIVVVGGDTPADFLNNAAGMVGQSGAQELQALFVGLVPASAAGQAVQNVQNAFPQAQPVNYAPEYAEPYQPPQQQYQQQAPPAQQQSRGPAGPPPGNTVLCPTHHDPAVFKSGRKNDKDYAFYKCATTDQIITDFHGKLKAACA